ncbi:MAG TPA: hypothetical protein DCL42_04955, partial [Deltaproteobacteria bacterium]|nr:hypothetical protein [Deltaproteobacteria bacterium]
MKKFIFILFLFFPASVYAQGWQGIDAANVKTDTTAFNNHLSAADDTVQAALETLDELVSGAVSDTAYSTSWNGVTDTA